ncbi:pre-mRNA-splicing factor 8 [Didymella keratinophila]|nr:pre-mRNA-splicing factor 8 [Didymella keratinophila]
MSSTASSLRPRVQSTPRERILAANIYNSTLQFITALLLTLMLLWHISTVTLIEKYYMPSWWEEAFVAELKKGWRTAVWVVVLSMVPTDCAHALLCLDWWCLLLYGRDDGYVSTDCSTAENSNGRLDDLSCGRERCADAEKEAAYTGRHELERSRSSQDRAIDASTPSRLSSNASPSSTTVRSSRPSALYTYHPFLHRRLSPLTQNALLTILDLAMLTILTDHIASYFLSLPRYFSHCNTLRVIAEPDFLFGDTGKFLNVRQGCIKLNVDIHVAGGFSTFLAIVLGMLHVSALVVRGWEYGQLGKEGVTGTAFDPAAKAQKERKYETASTDSSIKDPAVASSSALSERLGDRNAGQPGSSASTTSLRTSPSIGNEERGTGIGFRDWSAECAEHGVRRRARGTEDSHMETEDSKWSRVFLECLIP